MFAHWQRKLAERFGTPALERTSHEAALAAHARALTDELVEAMPHLDVRRTQTLIEHELRIASHDIRGLAYAGRLA